MPTPKVAKYEGVTMAASLAKALAKGKAYVIYDAAGGGYSRSPKYFGRGVLPHPSRLLTAAQASKAVTGTPYAVLHITDALAQGARFLCC